MQKLLIRLFYNIESHHRRWALIGITLLILLILINSTAFFWRFYYAMVDADPDRGAIAPQTDFCGDRVSKIVYLDQGWKASDSLWFYNISQGSDLVPYDFFLALEQAESTELFRSPENMNRFRYLPQKKTWSNPDALPVGMVKNIYRGKKFMGFTCAACHCSQVNFKETGMRIDGGPAAADMDTFMQAMDAAMEATLKDPAKEQRFVDAVRKGGNYSRESDITGDLHLYWLRLRAYNYFNESRIKKTDGAVAYDAPLAYGFARLDAFGRIYNRVLGHLLDPTEIEDTLLQTLPADQRDQIKADLQPFMAESDRDTLEARVLDRLPQAYQIRLRDEVFNSPNAPVSYPFLWDITQHDYVQWNGVAANAGEGPIGRNTGEVLGVFGTLDWERKPFFSLASVLGGQGFGRTHISFESSVKVHNLRLIEDRLAALRSPTWDDAAAKAGLPPIQWDKAERGERLFAANCAGCHANVDRANPDRRIVAHLDSVKNVGTDPQMADNSVKDTGYSGIIRNMYANSSVGDILLDTKAPAVALLTKATENVVLTPDPDKWFFTRGADWAVDLFDEFRLNPIKPSVKSGIYDADTTAQPFASVESYKARSLNGVWATAPFLHNGSVPTLYDLLLPADPKDGDPPGTEYRPKTFLVGSRDLDPEKVGFKTEGFPNGFRFDTTLQGNHNTGHEYGTRDETLSDGSVRKGLSKQDRWDLVEYLKSLGSKKPSK
jgi:mono/diheme cytochrome c family protein